MSMPPATAVPQSPSADTATDHRIRRRIEQNIHYYAVHPEEIDARLGELDREWDLERVLEANAAGIAFGGMLLGLFRHRGFFLLPLVAAGFLLQHALQGSCSASAVATPAWRTHGGRDRRRTRGAEVAAWRLRCGGAHAQRA